MRAAVTRAGLSCAIMIAGMTLVGLKLDMYGAAALGIAIVALAA
jgi:hypothetical protein